MKVEAVMASFTSRLSVWMMVAFPQLWIMRIHIVLVASIVGCIIAYFSADFIELPPESAGDNSLTMPYVTMLFFVAAATIGSIMWYYSQLQKTKLIVWETWWSGWCTLVWYVVCLVLLSSWPLLFIFRFEQGLPSSVTVPEFSSFYTMVRNIFVAKSVLVKW